MFSSRAIFKENICNLGPGNAVFPFHLFRGVDKVLGRSVQIVQRSPKFPGDFFARKRFRRCERRTGCEDHSGRQKKEEEGSLHLPRFLRMTKQAKAAASASAAAPKIQIAGLAAFLPESADCGESPRESKPPSPNLVSDGSGFGRTVSDSGTASAEKTESGGQDVHASFIFVRTYSDKEESSFQRRSNSRRSGLVGH